MTAQPQVILKKRLKLQWASGDPFLCTLHGLEYQEPYTLSLVLAGESSGRIDILKHELASELTAWLSGQRLEGKPALIIPKRINDAMMDFLKFGRPPHQPDIYLWILSRTVITWDDRSGMYLVFGKVSSDGTIPDNTLHEYSHADPGSDNQYGTDNTGVKKKPRPSSAPAGRCRRHSSGSSDSLLGTQKGAGTHKLTKEILGKSDAISQLKTEKIKGRASARPTFIRLGWTEDHYRLTNDISSRRHEIEDAMEERRKILEVSKARQIKATDTYRKIREGNAAKRSNYNWARDASYEVTNLDRITATITEDIQRQKCQSERTTEHIRWTMAPNGFVNRRGRYTKGLVLGPGPLPADATSGIKNPNMEKTLKSYYWDQHGRRQLREGDDVTPGSDIEKALCLLKKAAMNTSMYKLNLKQVFKDIDVSGDGFVSLSELRNFLATVGLKMENRFIDALFRHFDPNNSGSIHYGEFCWAFFNRRSLISQWKQNTKTLNDRQIKSKLHQADRNGNGILNRKEFSRLLKSFSIKMSDMEIDLLIDRFDRDGDGELDLKEFTAFIEAEINPSISNRHDNTLSSGTRPLRQSMSRSSNLVEQVEVVEPRATVDTTASTSNTNTQIPAQTQELENTDKTMIADYNLSGSIKLADVVNPAQLSQIFAHQAQIEAKLGEKYYKR